MLGKNRKHVDTKRGAMSFARLAGYPLSLPGIILYSPPVERSLYMLYGEAGRLSGLIVFSAGWGLLLAYLVFNLGMDAQRSRE